MRMALQGSLSAKSEDNDYGIDFKGTYYKIDNVRIDVARSEVRIEVRGYASKAARELQKEREEAKAPTIIGIYKKTFTVKLTDLKPKSLDQAAILTACYGYLKTQEDFEGTKDV